MLNQLFKYLEKPKQYTESTCEFWNDEHISKGMLDAHLQEKGSVSAKCRDAFLH